MKTEKDYYAVPAVSNSGMASINPEQGGTPARYKKFIVDHAKTEEDTPSLANGKLVHLYVEDPKQFVVSDIERPTEKLAAWIEQVHSTFPPIDLESANTDMIRRHALTLMEKYGNTSDPDKIWAKFLTGKDYFNFLSASKGKICMSPSQRSVVEGCIESLHKNKLAEKLLFNEPDSFGASVFNEKALYWDEVVHLFSTSTKLACKALLDRLIIDPVKKTATLIDLKTTGKNIAAFDSSFKYWRYYRQMGWYTRAIRKMLKDEYDDRIAEWDIDVWIVAVETHGLHETRVFRVSDNYLEKGEDEAMGLVERIAHATYYASWNQCQEEKSTGYLMLEPDE